MYLQLAERDPYSYLAESGKELYIFVPQGFKGAQSDMYIREDTLDNLSNADYQQLMFELEPYQNRGMSGKADRQQRRDARATKKASKGGGARREARQTRVATRQQAKVDKQTAKGTGKGAGFLDKIIGGATSIFGKEPALDVSYSGDGTAIDVSTGSEPSFMDKYKVPLIIGGVVLVAGGIYLATKKKK